MLYHKIFRLALLCLLLYTAVSVKAQSARSIVKRGKETGVFTGGVFIGWGARITGLGTTSLSGDTDTITEVLWKEFTGIARTGSILTKTASAGWGNAGGASHNKIDTLENGWVDCKINNLQTIFAFGLSVTNPDAGFNSIKYAVMVDSGRLSVYNQGVLIGNYGSAALNDSIRMERIGNILFYTKNNIVFYNQEINAKQPLLIDIAIYTSGASVAIRTTGKTAVNSYFRTAQNGNWDQLSTWEISSDSITWAGAAILPDYNSKTIFIQLFDTVTLTSSLTTDQTQVDGTLIYGNTAGSTLTINNGTGTDLTVNGTFQDIGPNSIVWADSSTWLLGNSISPMISSGTLLRTRSTSSDNWRDHYYNGISNIPATAYWVIRKTGTENPLLSSTGGMYYPNLTIENTSGSAWTTSGNSRFTGSTDYPRIKGVFNIGGSGTQPIVFINQNTDSIPVFVGGKLTVKSGSTLQNNGTGFNVGDSLNIFGSYTGTKNLFFNGTKIQTISNTTFSGLKVLNVNKPGGTLKFTIPVTVDSLLVLKSGNINIGNATVFLIPNGVPVLRTNGYISTTGTGVLKRPTASVNPYLIPLGNKTLNDSADFFVVTLTPGKTAAQEFTGAIHASGTGIIISYDTIMYGTGTETVKLDIITSSYTPLHLEFEINSSAHINAVKVLDQNDNVLKTLPANFYKIINRNTLELGELFAIGLTFGYGISTADLNWVYEVSYDANGAPVSEQKQYLDFIGRPTQLQIRNMADNGVLVSQTIYDNYGRAAVQTLPAPIGNVIAYQNNFITTSDGNAYSYSNFDIGTKINTPDPVSAANPGTLGAYYSDGGSEAFIATTSYPYARTEFTSDPSAGAKRSAKAGDEYRMGSGHETRGYSMVSGDELRYIFGSNTSYKSSIDTTNKLTNYALSITGGIQASKSISKDADGKEMVSYSAGGLAIASCYTGISGACSMTAVTSIMAYAGTSSVDIHLPAANKTSLKFPLPQYEYGGTQTVAASNITYKITDLNTNILLIYGTNYTVAADGSGVPTVTFLGGYASGSSVFRISYIYSPAWLITMAGFGLYGVTPPDAKVTYSLDYSRWSVNYYDLAGRLRKSVSPKGINCSSAGTITMASTYNYSAMGQLIASKSPDEGLKEMTYDDEGKARFTQNAVQLVANKFSYANYDAQGRSIESGEYASSNNGSSSVFFQNYYGAYSPPYSGNTASSAIINNIDNTGMRALDCNDKNQVVYYPLPSGEVIPAGYTYQPSYNARYLMGKICKTKNAQAETWYGYNQAGQTVFTVQQLKDADYTGLQTALNDQVKTVDYTYNTANGTLSDQTYQANKTSEKLKHFFEYDAALRLQQVNVSIGAGNKELQANYFYYKTGALKRKELGNKLQGIDYIYTVNGQLKSINQPSLDEAKDPGQDGKTGSGNAAFGKDVFGLTLDYHANDYLRYNSNILSNGEVNYYTGLINAQRYKTRGITNSVNNGADKIDPASLNITLITGTTDEIMNRYSYDEEYRLSTSVFGLFNNSTAVFTANANSYFKEYGASANSGIGYDANGNITSLKRNGYLAGGNLAMDDFTYTYISNTNKLTSIVDAAANVYGIDLVAATSKTFTSNSIGQMTTSEAEDVTDITYYATGLTKKVSFGSSRSAEYWYDDRGQKIKTKFYNASSLKAKYTWYMSDAGGNPLAIYEYDEAVAGTPAFTLVSQPVYGSGRLGVLDKPTGIIDYEITDHLGNVRATIKGISAGVYQLTARTDYYAFGGAQPGRTYNLNTYRFNYQGQESAVNSRWQAFDLRMHNSDLGRWFAPDPYGQFHSPYVSMGNNPVSGVDPDGGYAYSNNISYGIFSSGAGTAERHPRSDQQMQSDVEQWFSDELDRIHLLEKNGYLSYSELNTLLNEANRQLGSLKSAIFNEGKSIDDTYRSRGIAGDMGASQAANRIATHAPSSWFASGNAENDWKAANGGSAKGFYENMRELGGSTQNYLTGKFAEKEAERQRNRERKEQRQNDHGANTFRVLAWDITIYSHNFGRATGNGAFHIDATYNPKMHNVNRWVKIGGGSATFPNGAYTGQSFTTMGGPVRVQYQHFPGAEGGDITTATYGGNTLTTGPAFTGGGGTWLFNAGAAGTGTVTQTALQGSGWWFRVQERQTFYVPIWQFWK